MDWQDAPDVQVQIREILKYGLFPHVNPAKITCLRGHGSTSRAIARIWSLPRPWQLALNIGPQYVIEVIAERFDKLSSAEREKTLIHELLHIPRTFSGALLAHRNRGRSVDSRTVGVLYDHLTARRKSNG